MFSEGKDKKTCSERTRAVSVVLLPLGNNNNNNKKVGVKTMFIFTTDGYVITYFFLFFDCFTSILVNFVEVPLVIDL